MASKIRTAAISGIAFVTELSGCATGPESNTEIRACTELGQYSEGNTTISIDVNDRDALEQFGVQIRAAGAIAVSRGAVVYNGFVSNGLDFTSKLGYSNYREIETSEVICTNETEPRLTDVGESLVDQIGDGEVSLQPVPVDGQYFLDDRSDFVDFTKVGI